MSSLTQYRVRVESPFPVIELTGLQVQQRENAHALAMFTGILDDETGFDTLHRQLEGKLVRFMDQMDGTPIFAGYIQTAEVAEESGFYSLSATALSGSIQLDQTKRSRSYQDVTLLYNDVLRMALGNVRDADFIMRVQDKPIGVPLVQYAETDWEFAMRLASHFNTTITPDMDTGLPRFWMGLRAPFGSAHDFSDCEYRAVIEGKYYDVGASQLGFSRSQFFNYVVKDFANRPLGGRAHFQGRDLFICRKSCVISEDGLPVYSYTLGQPELLAHQKYYNENLTGLTLLGKVIATQGGTVKLHLNIDESQDMATAYNYRWAPPTGNYMYLMPKIGSEVSLYFSDPGEDSAKAVNCVRAGPSTSAPGFANPSKRGLSSEHEKNMLLYPDRFGFESKTGGGPLQLMCNDAVGVTLETIHSITILGDEGVTLEAPEIELTSPKQTAFYYMSGQEITESFAPPTSITLIEGGTLCDSEAGKAIIVGHDVRTYPPYDDKPEEGQFDWGGLFGNILAGLAVVACVILVVATFGVAGPILIAGAIAGAAAVAAMAVGDVMRGNVSSTEDYMREAFIGTVVGLVTGAMGSAFSGAKAATTIGKLALSVGKGALIGSTGSALSELMRTGLTGQEMDWNRFGWTVLNGAIAGGIASPISDKVGALLQNTNPHVNALLSATCAGGTAFVTNVGMQIFEMAIFSEDGVNLNNIDWQAATTSAIISFASSLAGSYANRALAKQQPEPTSTDDDGQGRLPGGVENADDPDGQVRLDRDGKFDDPDLEASYKKYVQRKQNAGETPRDRLDWKSARDYYLNDSPMARGNRFNDTASIDYDYNEVHLENGKRLDSYDPDAGEIVSRKATDLNMIKEDTYRSYLQEVLDKYPAGTTIRSNKYPDIDGTPLQGDYILEVPSSNANLLNIDYYKQIAEEYGIRLRFRSE
ncbi:MAG: hypothetical protein LBH09_08000 [Peptococcaceae bacterium]|jgi:hypothetical protein|nr:hypothetical protein [Peptococcaceae bacterium]